MTKNQDRISIALNVVGIAIMLSSRLFEPGFVRYGLQVLGGGVLIANLAFMWWGTGVEEGEDRKVFARAEDSSAPTARIDLCVGISSIFTAIGAASLASDLIRWREFFASFLGFFDRIGQAIISALPFHLPPDRGPSVIVALSIMGIMGRIFYLMSVRAKALSPAWTAGLCLFVVTLVSIQLTQGRAPLDALKFIAFVMLLLGVIGGAGIFAREASARLLGFYTLQSVAWFALWGLVMLFIGAEIIR